MAGKKTSSSKKKTSSSQPKSRTDQSRKLSQKTQCDPTELMHSSERLREAAFAVFAKSGYHGATTKLIAQEAGVNEALISRHFGGKQGLFLDVVKHRGIPQPSSFPFPIQATLEEELYRVLEFMVDSRESNAEFMRIVTIQGLTDPEFLRAFKEEIEAPCSPALTTRLKVFQADQRLSSKVDLNVIEHFIQCQAFSISFLCHMFGVIDPKTTLKDARGAIRVFCKGLESA